MLTIHNPEKALASLPSPLLATDTLAVSHSPDVQLVKLTAGLHRQTWVNGGAIFVDVHVVNRTAKTMKKIEVQLEKTTLWYSHAAAGTAEKTASHLRLPKRREAEVISNTVLKKSKDWQGIGAHLSEVRTCELSAPRGHVTISSGRYFEIRYFVNIIVTVSMFKSCAVQLPITLIHMNSLDILPNSLAQVAASIEAKRQRTVPARSDSHQPYYQGQAFAAPRRQSLDRSREQGGFESKDISLLTQDLDNSPRRYGTVHGHRRGRQSSHISNENMAPCQSTVSAAHHHHKHHASCYHCNILYNEHEARPGTATSQEGPGLPRLQVSTSGLGFSESEFEVPADSPPRKVMLSEHERKMINQQKELKLQHEQSHNRRKQSLEQVDANRPVMRYAPPTWRNVAAEPKSLPPGPSPFDDVVHPGKGMPARTISRKMKGKEPVRSRSRTNSEYMMSARPSQGRRRSVRSVDSSRRASENANGPSMMLPGAKKSRETAEGRVMEAFH